MYSVHATIQRSGRVHSTPGGPVRQSDARLTPQRLFRGHIPAFRGRAFRGAFRRLERAGFSKKTTRGSVSCPKSTHSFPRDPGQLRRQPPSEPSLRLPQEFPLRPGHSPPLLLARRAQRSRGRGDLPRVDLPAPLPRRLESMRNSRCRILLPWQAFLELRI